MSNVVQFWEADGKGEALIREYRVKVLQAIADAALARPSRCVLVTLSDTGRPRTDVIELWRKPGYHSSTGDGPGLLNMWKPYI